ncbi:metallophosphoesterase, partial [Acinetobacter baumannii]
AAWPFKLGATLSASLKPDLVLHVGDFHYREKPCPAGNDGCAGSPWGDNWDVWREDFFAPADSLLRAAPWIMVRGNHELCDRGGHGWA